MLDLDGYFARIGYAGPRAPTLATLEALQALHPAAIPFEAIDVLLDRRIDLEPAAIDAKLIGRRRGGYCYEQNDLFARVLRALGFEVENLVARVLWGAPPGTAPRPRTHRVSRVEVEGASYLCDVGFGGCVLTAPLRLAADERQVTPHDTYRLRRIPEGLALAVAREAGWLDAYHLSLEPAVAADYEMANWFTSTHPGSHFRHNLVVARTTPQARYNLLFNRLTVRPVGAEPARQRLDAAGVERALIETFGLTREPAWAPLYDRAVTMGDASGI